MRTRIAAEGGQPPERQPASRPNRPTESNEPLKSGGTTIAAPDRSHGRVARARQRRRAARGRRHRDYVPGRPGVVRRRAAQSLDRRDDAEGRERRPTPVGPGSTPSGRRGPRRGRARTTRSPRPARRPPRARGRGPPVSRLPLLRAVASSRIATNNPSGRASAAAAAHPAALHQRPRSAASVATAMRARTMLSGYSIENAYPNGNTARYAVARRAIVSPSSRASARRTRRAQRGSRRSR